MNSAPASPRRIARGPESGTPRAFTLIEIMVSMSILVVLIVILMSMVDGATKLWRHTENRVDSYREARAAINTVAADINSILISTNVNFFSLDRTDNLPSSARKPPAAGNIFFLSAQPKESQNMSAAAGSQKSPNASDFCLVGYFLAYDKVSTGSPSPSLNLYRYFLSSGETFDSILKGNLLSDTLSTSPSASAPTGAEVLARNVTSFKVEALSLVPADPADPNSPVSLKKFVQDKNYPLPDIIEIEMTALNNESVKRFNSESDWSDTNSATYKQNARTFKTTVHLRAEAVTNVTPTPTPTPTPVPSS